MNVPPNHGPARRPPPLPAATPHNPSASVGSGVNRVLPLVLIGVAISTLGVAIILAGLFVGQRLMRRSTEDVETEIAETISETEVAQTIPDVEIAQAIPEMEIAQTISDPAPEAKPLVPDSATVPEPATPVVPDSLPVSELPKESLKPQRDVFSDIAKRQNRLVLPAMFLEKVDAFSTGKVNTNLEPLAELVVEDVKQCELSVEGREFTETRTGQHKLKRKDDDGGCSWNLLTTTSTGVSQEWGVFRLEGGKLKFQWKSKPPVRLQFCQLNIKVGDQTECCHLNRVEQVPAVQYDIDKPVAVSLKGLEGLWREGDPLRVELQFEGPSSKMLVNGVAGNVLAVGETGEIRLRSPLDANAQTEADGAVLIEIALERTASRNFPKLRVALCASLRSLQWDAETGTATLGVPEKLPITLKKIDEWRDKATQDLQQFIVRKQAFWLNNWAKLSQEERHGAVAMLKLQKLLAAERSLGQKQIADARKELLALESNSKNLAEIVQNFRLLDSSRLSLAETYNTFRESKERRDRWCGAMKTYLEEGLNGQAKVQYRAYMDFPEGPLDLEITAGFRR
ncbi:MAG: hypothetical protein NTY19_03410 [Planctomycetota bacterium]|nr:hypothetical protein [Planctomycetota bacterium]